MVLLIKHKYLYWIISGIPMIVLLFLHPSQLGKIGIVEGKVVAAFLFFCFIFFAYLFGLKLLLNFDAYHIILSIQIIFALIFGLIKWNYGSILLAATLLSIFVFYSYLKLDDDLIIRSARLYIWVMSAVSIGAMIAFIGFYLGCFEQTLLISINSGDDLYLIGPSLTSEVLKGGGVIRPAGPFNEPGQLGLHILFALILNMLIDGSRKYESILLAGGLVTLSLGTYIGMLLYFILWRLSIIKIKNMMIPLFIFISIMVIFLYIDDYLIDYVNIRITSLGDFGNRGLGYRVFFENIGAINLFGVDDKYSDILFDASSDVTAFGMMVRYGYIGWVIINLHVIYFLTKSIKGTLRSNIYKGRVLFLISCLIISMLFHRPFVVMFSFYLLILLVHRLSIPRGKLLFIKGEMISHRYCG